MHVKRRVDHARVETRVMAVGSVAPLRERMGRVLGWILILCAFFCAPARLAAQGGARGFYLEPGEAPSPMAEWRVFMVATNIYPRSIGSLKYAEKDVDDLYSHFLEIGVPLSNITVLKSSLDGEDRSQGTSRDAILSAYNKFLRSLDENSIAFVYFSGHGYCKKAADGAIRSYYAAYRFKLEQGETNSISLDDVLLRLSNSRARFKWMCVDACRELAPNSRGGLFNDLRIENVPQGLWLTQSCRAGQQAFEGGLDNGRKVENGLFTRALLAAISGELAADEDQDGTVTLGELQRYVESRVATDAARFFQAKQNPEFTAIGEDPSQIKAIPVFPDLPVNGYPSAVWRRGRGLMRESDELRELGDYDLALEKIDEALELLKDAEDLIRRKIALERLRDPGDCANKFYGLAVAAFETGDYKFAAALAAAALKEAPTNAEYLKLLRRIEEQNDDVEIPVKPDVDVIQTAFQEAKLNFDAGNAATDKEEKDAYYLLAATEIEKATQNNPNNVEYRILSELIQYVRSPEKPREAKHTPGESRTVLIAGIPTVFHWCPPGSSYVSLPKPGEPNASVHEKVEFTHGFWLAETETSQRLWRAVMGNNPSAFPNDERPVETISWLECREFVDRLNRLGVAPLGAFFSLPTVAQLGYACRAGSTTRYWWGDRAEDGEGKVNGWDRSVADASDEGAFPFDDGYPGTAPVDAFEGNAWGLKNLLGNVEEYALDRMASDWNGVNDANDSFVYEADARRCNLFVTCFKTGFEHCVPSRGLTNVDERTEFRGFRLLLTDESAPESYNAIPPETSLTMNLGRPYGDSTFDSINVDDAPLAHDASPLRDSTTCEEAYNRSVAHFCNGLDAEEPLRSSYLKIAYSEIRKAIASAHAKSEYRLVAAMMASRLQEHGIIVSTTGETSRPEYREGITKTLLLSGIPTRFRWIPSGESRVTRPSGSDFSLGVERDVSLRGYWIAETETTQALWQAIMGANPSQRVGWDLPVDSVSWLDCQEFIRRLNCANYAPKGAVFTLPTEAQWERACRSAEDEDLEWADDYDATESAPVMETRVSSSGTRGMIGNVAELCLDRFSEAWNGEKNLVDPLNYDANGDAVILRGGSWRDDIAERSSSYRGVRSVRAKSETIGFRLVLTNELTPEAALAIPEDLYPRERRKSLPQTRRAGETFTVALAGVPTVFRWCPPGAFIMGSPETEHDRKPGERRRRVRLTRGFWLAETETTQALWKAVMRYNPSVTEGDDHPVDRICWNEAQAFVRALNERGYAPKGCYFSLPTEAQWEYACRAGSRTAYWWGDSPDGALGNACWHETNGGRSLPVGTLAANAWGFRDMSGNVYEWCADAYEEESRVVLTDPLPDGDSRRRVMRGGSWMNAPELLRSAYRHLCDEPHIVADDCGVRLLMTDSELIGDLSEYSAPTTWRFPEFAPSERDLSCGDGVPVAQRVAGSWKIVEIAGIPTKFHWVPAGKYRVGWQSGREITLTRGYWLAETETTQELWEAVTGENPSYYKGRLHPVECVTWQMVQEFLAQLNAAGYAPSGSRFTLPSCAQWEVASRARATTKYWWGDDDRDGYGKLNGLDECFLELDPEAHWPFFAFKDGYPRTAPVGTFEANAWGFHDIAGNVWELCQDAVIGDSDVDPFGDEPKDRKGFWGGSWSHTKEACQSHNGNCILAKSYHSAGGFRLLLTEPQSDAKK